MKPFVMVFVFTRVERESEVSWDFQEALHMQQS
jgi:hypothetical protein